MKIHIQASWELDEWHAALFLCKWWYSMEGTANWDAVPQIGHTMQLRHSGIPATVESVEWDTDGRVWVSLEHFKVGLDDWFWLYKISTGEPDGSSVKWQTNSQIPTEYALKVAEELRVALIRAKRITMITEPDLDTDHVSPDNSAE